MIQQQITLETDRSRRMAIFLFLAAAFLSPAIPLPAGLPAVRLEQVLLVALLAPLAIYHLRHRTDLRPHVVDFAFAGLLAAITFTLALAPILVDEVQRSPRDLFELARVVEYWAAFRLALAAGGVRSTFSGASLLLAGAAVVSGLIAAVQYLDPGAFNGAVTDLWANSHNLDGVIKRGRAVGFVGNPNYFGALSGLLLVSLLARATFAERGSGGRMTARAMIAGIALATAGLLLSQSRTATFATVGSLGVGFVWTTVTVRSRASYLVPVVTVVLAALATLTFAEAFPPDYGGLRQRFQIRSLSEDSSFSLRVTRWRNFVESIFSDPPSICTGEPLDSAVVPGHEPPSSSAPAAGEEGVLDARREEDVRNVAGALLDYFCEEDRWPVEDPVGAIVPAHLPAMPRDPATGEDYDLYVISGGFVVSARLANPLAPAGPVFALGTMPNYVANSSFENGRSSPAGWATTGAADGRAETRLEPSSAARFGERSVLARIGGGSSFYQQIVQDFPRGQEYTVALWGRAIGEDERVQLYLVGTTADGTVLDPLAQSEPIELTTDEWRPGSFTFVTPGGPRLVVVSLFVRSMADDDPVEAVFDAVTMTPGPLIPSFPWVRDARRAERSSLPSFRDSPLVGVGPLKDVQLGALDNEYALFLDRYGVLGLAAYLGLFGSAFWTGLRAAKRRTAGTIAAGLGLAVGTVGLMVFSIAAGSYYNFQLMAVFWPLVGIAAAASEVHGEGRDDA